MVKRDKRSRLRGSRSAGHGAKKKYRGKGSRGGVGMAGTGKKSGHKKTFILKHMPGYLGKKGFVRHGATKIILKTINLGNINLKLKDLQKKGLAKSTAEGMAIDLKKYKILGDGEIDQPLIITAGSFSASAKKKIEAKGGKALKK